MIKSKIKNFSCLVSRKIQRFGNAMITPVLLITFAGVLAVISTTLTNPILLGSLACEDTAWFKIWNMTTEVALVVLRPSHLPMIFVVGLPISLATKHKAEACLESLVLYLSFVYFLNLILTHWGNNVGINLKEGAPGVKNIVGMLTLDMGILGTIAVVGIVIYLHNRYFDLKIPKFSGMYQGMVFIYFIGFFAMLFLAFICAIIWPPIQCGIASMQQFFMNSGNVGVGVYGFLERILVPTGLHRFVYAPFIQDNAVVDGGIIINWITNMDDFSKSTAPLKTLFPAGKFSLFGNAKIFGSIGMSLAFYFTAKPEKKKKALSLLIPATLTAVLFGITEPFDLIFLFTAPILFFVHAILAGFLEMIMYVCGVSGCMHLGLVEMLSANWIPLFKSHGFTYVKQIIIGLIFVALYFFVFEFLIKKFDYKTLGREDDPKESKINKALEDAMMKKKLCFTQNIYRLEMEYFKNSLRKLRMKENDRRFEEIAFAAVILKHHKNIDEVEVIPDIFSYIGQILNIQPKSVHSNFRNALDRHWLNTDLKILEKNYQGPISEESGAPTPKDFLVYIVKEAIKEESKGV